MALWLENVKQLKLSIFPGSLIKRQCDSEHSGAELDQKRGSRCRKGEFLLPSMQRKRFSSATVHQDWIWLWSAFSTRESTVSIFFSSRVMLPAVASFHQKDSSLFIEMCRVQWGHWIPGCKDHCCDGPPRSSQRSYILSLTRITVLEWQF